LCFLPNFSTAYIETTALSTKRFFARLIFGSGRIPQNLSFKYNGSEIEVVKNFNYFGIIFSKTGNFNLAKKRLVGVASTNYSKQNKTTTPSKNKQDQTTITTMPE
jgi:hypothetical protein